MIVNASPFFAQCVIDKAVLTHNTMNYLAHGLDTLPESAGPGAAPDRQPVRIHLSENLFDPSGTGGGRFSMLLPPESFHEDAKPLSVEEAERLLPRLMAWREERNLYRKGSTYQGFTRVKDPGGPKREFIHDALPAARTFADWQRLWKTGDSGSAEGVIRYEGGNMLAKARAAPERVTPADFRLRPDSAGYRAGKDRKDLGADVDLVGPGAAYERWKKTPEYQQWLKDTEQLKK
jgi:hypothetical protein